MSKVHLDYLYGRKDHDGHFTNMTYGVMRDMISP